MEWVIIVLNLFFNYLKFFKIEDKYTVDQIFALQCFTKNLIKENYTRECTTAQDTYVWQKSGLLHCAGGSDFTDTNSAESK